MDWEQGGEGMMLRLMKGEWCSRGEMRWMRRLLLCSEDEVMRSELVWSIVIIPDAISGWGGALC